MLRILTLNLDYDGERHGPWPRRRPLVAAAVREAAADLVCLQAVLRDPARGVDQLAELLAELPQHRYAFYVAAEPCGGGSRGSAFLSRLPLRAPGYARLARRRRCEDPLARVLLSSSVDSGGGTVRVLNAHFSWVQPQARDNVKEALRYLDGGSTGPALLVGDFNMEPRARPLSRLRRAGWRDAWEALRPGHAGATFEAPAPSKRIDYAWASPAVEPRLDQARVLSLERDGARLSNHLALLVSIR